MLELLKWCAFAVFCGGALYECNFSEWARRQDAAREAQERAEQKPHVIREADGCKVYAFKANGDLHYFTRCDNGMVSTERNWTERQGKRTVNKSETIVTENNH